jgi:Transposase zinc-binding domain/Putative transposase
MARPALEVADILRDHGSAWRDANQGHVSLGQLKVMSAIERCRTAALGGHVARCENAACAHTEISYNSCGDRHCPKCQGAASRRWLADREAELLPVPYFHVVYTLPSELRDIAYQNKRVIYNLLMKAAAETTLTIASDPKRLGARIGVTAVLHSWGSALTHHPHVHMIVPGGGLSFDHARWVSARSNFFVHVNVLARLFRGKMLAMLMHAHTAGELKFFNAHAELTDKRTFKRFIAPLRLIKWVVYCKRAVRRARAGAALSLPLHPSGRYLQPPPRCGRQRGDCVPLEGLSRQRRQQRCGFTHTSSSGAFSSTCYPKASIASATTGSLPPPTAPRASQPPAHSSKSPRPLPIPSKSPMAPRTRCACCPGHARAVARA